MVAPRNPYVIEKGSPKLQLSVVAFLDVLGYADLVRESSKSRTSDELLKKLHNVLRTSRKHIDPKQRDSTFKKDWKKDFSAFRAFTDNIVIGRPIKGRGDGEVELVETFNELSYFQMVMAMDGFFVRGAIAIGDLYMDDIAVFGPGLVEAYDAEHSLARDPRIIIAQSAREAVNQHLEYYGRHSHAPQVSCLLKDSDGQYFIHYLDTLISEGEYFFETELQRHKESIETKLKQHSSRPPVWSKYIWVANYHNYFCRNHSKVAKSYMINLEDYKVTPALIVD